MSDASPDLKLGPVRQLRPEEAAIIKKMVTGTVFEKAVVPQLEAALVQDMQDGGMGSIQFHRQTSDERRFGKEIAEGTFRDNDGVLVSVTLNLDQFGELFELDVWKVDFSPLVRYPEPSEFTVIIRPGKMGFAAEQ